MKVLTADEMRRVEQKCIENGITTHILMENAGRAVAEQTRRILGNIESKHIILLIGPGNNGGDGLVAARYLHDWGAKVVLFLLGKRDKGDNNLKLIGERGITSYDNLEQLGGILLSTDAVIDALFGTGRSRPIKGDFKRALEQVNETKKQYTGLNVIAIDLPSGLDADSGACDPVCVYTDNTVTLGFPKPGLYNSPGAGMAGMVTIVDIGIPEYLIEGTKTEIITDEWASSVLPQRPLEANKSTFGKVLAIAGSLNYIGAAYLACSGAIRVGAGLVNLATAGSLQAILATKLTEVTHLPLPESAPGIISAEAVNTIIPELKLYNVLLLGCGLGQSKPVTAFIQSAILQTKYKLPLLVLDADALNTLAKIPGWWRQITADAILTPHPGEMARLTGRSVVEIQSNRIEITREMASKWEKIIILKGAYSVIAAPDGHCRICPVANTGLASAGTGDVLAGVVAGLLAQGLNIFDAAGLGVWLHAKAGESVKAEMGDTGMIASDLLPILPLEIKKLKEKVG
ncbi:MAG: NAD(P)H-hydrate dehydratase [Dehalococcoidia bacterium]|nr:MAG: NAD(P)H-hydrate dehydratase [Dehalococcoidia bacterium]